jgi:hypothetical protein
MVDDDSRLSGVDESSQSGTSFPEGGTSLQNAVLYHATHAMHAAMYWDGIRSQTLATNMQGQPNPRPDPSRTF